MMGLIPMLDFLETGDGFRVAFAVQMDSEYETAGIDHGA